MKKSTPTAVSKSMLTKEQQQRRLAKQTPVNKASTDKGVLTRMTRGRPISSSQSVNDGGKTMIVNQ